MALHSVLIVRTIIYKCLNNTNKHDKGWFRTRWSDARSITCPEWNLRSNYWERAHSSHQRTWYWNNGWHIRFVTKSTTKVAFQPRTLEIEHFLGVKADIVKISSSKPIVHFFDEADPRVWVRSIDMVEQVDPTPAFPIVSIFESFCNILWFQNNRPVVFY